MTAPPALPAFAEGLCDDAAVFPPGLMPLPEAVPAHRRHRAAPYAAMVGPLVLGASALRDLAPLLGDGRECALDLTVTLPEGPERLPEALAMIKDLPVDLRGLEVAVPAGTSAAAFFAALDRACEDAADDLGDAIVFVEVPRDDRRPEVIKRLAGSRHRAKFRTGGVRAELYPDEAELAAAILATLEAGLSFKATAGLHHAVRNTDPQSGFEQHGFLNVLLAVDAALGGGSHGEVAAVLTERDPKTIATGVANLDGARVSRARARFLSFGTCSIAEPLADLVSLGLVPAAIAPGQGGGTP